MTDDELARLAMAADPDQPIDADAVPISLASGQAVGLLPEWYMPTPTASVRGRARRALVGTVVIALIVLSGAGLCVTYGFAEIAW